MTQKNQPPAEVKLVRRKSSLLTKLAVVTALVLSLAAVVSLRSAAKAVEQDTEALRQQVIALELENERLQQYRREEGTLAEILRVAQERLGLTLPDSIVIQPK